MKLLVLLILLQVFNSRSEPLPNKAYKKREILAGPRSFIDDKSPRSTAFQSSSAETLSISECHDCESIRPTKSTLYTAYVVTSTVVPIVSVITKPIVSGIAQIIPSVNSLHIESQKESPYSLNTFGHETMPPLIQTDIAAPTTTVAPVSITRPSKKAESILISGNIFQPVATSAPPSTFSTRTDHPVPRLGIKTQTSPLQTNKFYANFYLGNQTARAWTHPYSIGWAKGDERTRSWGMSIMHVDSSKRVFGPKADANPVNYYTNPLGDFTIIISSSELSSSTILTTDSLNSMSVNVNLHPDSGSPAQITFPLVQGMGFVTAIFHSGTPILQSTVLFRSITKISTAPKPGVSKFKIDLEDNTSWLMYAYSLSDFGLEFQAVSNALIQATSNFEGIIQIAKNTPNNGSAEAMYDEACGAYATSVEISGSANGDSGSYTFTFAKGGLADTKLVMFALPHHMSSFSSETLSQAKDIQLDTTTKGKATAIVADLWTMVENLPSAMGFGPWNPKLPNEKIALSPDTMKAIHTVASYEISQNMSNQTNLDSIYFSGKALSKFALISYILKDVLGDAEMAEAGLNNLKECYAIFTSNKNKNPLIYESAWKGVVSSASYTTGNMGDDFGNTYYNDHHFHYGYFILTAAIIGYMDPDWITANKDYVNSLVRDIANPSPLDNYFPVSRNFDWYHGHSWAHGLYESSDGKDQESSSEDSMSAYALKMWGHVTGDANMEARGNLQLAINARSIQSYYLYEQGNKIEPDNFVGNKAAGILFENKIDCTTFFGEREEFIHGIHMVPILPNSALVRKPNFVKEEWDAFFSQGRADTAVGGWRGILYANLALVDPKTAWNFFNSANFDNGCLDGGSSRTWYMTLAAGLGGS